MKIKNQLAILLLFVFAFVSIQQSNATTAYPKPVNVVQSDGSVLNLTLKGDERLSWATTPDGYTLVYNTQGIFEYGQISRSGDLVPSGVKARNVSERTQAELSFLSALQKGLTYNASQTSIAHQIRSQEITMQAFPTTGNRKLVCILVAFTDVAFTRTQAEFDNLFNQVGFSTDGALGSVKDFFFENSYGQLTLTTDVFGPYTVSDTRAYYGAHDGSDNDIRPREMVTEAVNLANGDVDFTQYDNDSDGNVDGVYVIYAGCGEEAGAGANAIWAHAWSIPAVSLDGVNVSRYSCSAEARGSSGTNLSRIGVICHEFGHILGAPDFYDVDYATDGQYNGTGHWDLQASGNWNNDAISPSHSNPYTKAYIYNWASVTTLTTQGLVTLQPAATNSGSFYRFNTTTPGEFFIMENRQQANFDLGIPGHGLLIYHSLADLTSFFGSNNPNATSPQRFYPVCASANEDPSGTVSSYGNNDDAGTTFPGTSNQTNFTDATLPSTKSNAGADSEQPIAFISEDVGAGTVSFCYLGCSTVADFSANNLTPCTGDIVTFTDLSTYSPTSWAWSFSPNTVSYAGGTTAASQNPQVIFNASGAYTVTLTATNEYGSDPEVKNNYINVNAIPTVTLQPVSQAVQWGDNVSFTSTAIGPPSPTVQWELSINDGGTWNNIDGATSTTLSLTCVTLEQSGYQYRAVFTNVCGSTPSNAATLTVTPRVTSGVVSISPNPQQYSDPTTLSVVLSNAVACGQQAATGVTFYIGTQLMGSVVLTINGTSLEASLPVLLLEPTPFGTAPTGQMSPGVHTVTAVFTGVNSNFTVVDATAPITITQEDARVLYTGASFVSTSSVNSSNATITLAATIKDITAVPLDPAYDAYAGDIRNATVTFINRDNNTVIAANVPLGLVNPSDPTVAVASFNWNVSIIGNAQTFTVGIIIGNYYIRNNGDDNTLITVAKPLSDFVAGGGYLVLSNSVGIKAGDVGSKNNFGFSVKFNRRGTNLQGNYNSLIRRTESSVEHTYQVKSSHYTSLSIQRSSVGGKATINGKANITDVTNPSLPVSVASNCTFQIKMTDNGQPGNTDSIALTIWNSAGGLWYASNWNGWSTIEQVLAAGNLKVNSNSSFRAEDELVSSGLSLYPNPTDGHFSVVFNSNTESLCAVRLMDNLGRVVLAEDIQALAGDNLLEYNLGNLSNGIYYFMLDVDNNHEVFKVVVDNR
jgi:M6 family metalloprotease-like protein